MITTIRQIQGFRRHLLAEIADLTKEELNRIPSGCPNNIAWQLGHVIAAQQMLCYVRAGLPVLIPEAFYLPFLTGTRPETVTSAADIAELKRLATATLDQLADDYTQGKFLSYSPSAGIQKVYGFPVTHIDEALSYLLYHEGYHAGQVRYLKNLI